MILKTKNKKKKIKNGIPIQDLMSRRQEITSSLAPLWSGESEREIGRDISLEFMAEPMVARADSINKPTQGFWVPWTFWNEGWGLYRPRESCSKQPWVMSYL